MKAQAFDELSRGLGTVATRRGVLHVLGSVTAVGAVAVTGTGEAEAKKKPKITICFQSQTRKVKKKGWQQNFPGATKGACATGGACTLGQQITQLQVPYTGVAVLSPVLALGQVYTVQVSGAAATNATRSVDAEYDFENANPNTILDSAGGVDFGLSIDDPTTDATKTPKWGPYNPAHVYSQKIIGQGRPVSLLMQDSIYTDNSGFVTVTITCG